MPDTNLLSKYLKADHVKDDDIIKFLDAGTIEEKEFKDTKTGKTKTNNILEMTVEVKGIQRVYSPNSQSVKFLSDAFGSNTEKWVGREAKVTIGLSNNKQNIIIAKPVLTEAEKAASNA